MASPRSHDTAKYLFHPPNIDSNSTDPDLDKFLAAVFATDPVDDRSILSSQYGPIVAGTCEWIVEHPLYQKWQKEGPLLWLSGAPKKGKTFLARYLTEQFDRSNTIFYFCQQDGQRDTVQAVLRGLIYQLVKIRPQLFSIIKLDYKSRGNRTFLSVHTMWRMLCQMAEDCERIFCIIDNLDGCDDSSLPDFLGLCKESPPELRILLTSRAASTTIVQQLHGTPRIDLDADDEDICDDTRKYVRDQTRRLAESPGYSPQLCGEIETAMLGATEDSFVWVASIFAQLKKKPASEAAVILDSIPSGLQALYEEILKQINPADSNVLEKMFSWVVVAFRPLTPEELAIAVGLDSSRTVIEYVARSRHFLQVVDGRVRFIHQSAKRYLRQADSGSRYACMSDRAHLIAASKCYSFVLSNEIYTGRLRLDIIDRPKELRKYPFLEYATLYWSEHSRKASKEVKDLFDLSDAFCREESPVRENWLRAYTAFLETAISGGSTLLHVAALVDLVPLARKVIRSERWKLAKSLNKRSSKDATPLYVASGLGHEQMVDLLIAEGADINAEGPHLGFPLQAAAFNGHVMVVKLLLQAGANSNLVAGQYATALQAAAKRGHLSIVQMLIEAKANVNVIGGVYGTALQGAVRGRHKDIVHRLLKAGADSNEKGGAKESPLTAAIQVGDKAIEETLRNAGAKNL